MIREKFGEILGEFGLPYAFWEFDIEDDIPDLPYLVYYDIDPTLFYADNQAYYFANQFAVEFYSEKKDDSKIRELEAFFISQGWTFTYEPGFIPEEELYQEYFEIQTY